MKPIFRSMSDIEEEIKRRITAHERSRPGASVSSRAKLGARAQELSDLLGWLRGNERP